VEELPHVFWAHRTVNKTSNRETHSSLTYGREAMISAEIGILSARSQNLYSIENDVEFKRNLDALKHGGRWPPSKKKATRGKWKRPTTKRSRMPVQRGILRTKEQRSKQSRTDRETSTHPGGPLCYPQGCWEKGIHLDATRWKGAATNME
jgi:hypothetical protein